MNVKHVERWLDVTGFECCNHGLVPQVLVALDYVACPTRVLRAGESISDKFEIETTIGTGQSVVKKAKNKLSQKEYAIKLICKNKKGLDNNCRSIEREVELLKTTSHPNIVQLYETIESADTTFLVMELIKGPDLFDVHHILGNFRPALAGAIIGQLLAALAYLHSRGISHRDIKPENIIVDYFANKIKLTDFGSADYIKTMSGVAGTLNYMAPELLLNMRGVTHHTDQSVDIWAVGIVSCLLLSGLHPFDRPTKANNNIIKSIIAGKFSFPSPQWDSIPKDCKDFIKKCLSVDPKKRPTSSELRKHAWIVSTSSSAAVNAFTKKDQDLLDLERNSRNSSRTSSVQSLIDLFEGNNVVVRS